MINLGGLGLIFRRLRLIGIKIKLYYNHLHGDSLLGSFGDFRALALSTSLSPRFLFSESPGPDKLFFPPSLKTAFFTWGMHVAT